MAVPPRLRASRCSRTKLMAVYSIIRDGNLPSQRVAERNGMRVVGRLVKHNYGMEMPHDVWGVSREEDAGGK